MKRAEERRKDQSCPTHLPWAWAWSASRLTQDLVTGLSVIASLRGTLGTYGPRGTAPILRRSLSLSLALWWGACGGLLWWCCLLIAWLFLVLLLWGFIGYCEWLFIIVVIVRGFFIVVIIVSVFYFYFVYWVFCLSLLWVVWLLLLLLLWLGVRVAWRYSRVCHGRRGHTFSSKIFFFPCRCYFLFRDLVIAVAIVFYSP